ncbi:hypothetical protein HanHA300_Chr04g0129791 [Helianthus annuus]|nr:hypothetical protein HanHA300_Chr04g0129791 [Helianthus annuus]KAJ0596446.1 hypothetical protein HanHA89_Chr04g0142841 [Helianthus annuus]KAJ0757106.1 hypothetical protein HanLR1_Chr04g0134761 [Helianthus annuus]
MRRCFCAPFFKPRYYSPFSYAPCFKPRFLLAVFYINVTFFVLRFTFYVLQIS